MKSRGKNGFSDNIINNTIWYTGSRDRRFMVPVWVWRNTLAVKINHKTELTIPVRNLVGLIIAVAVFVWAYFAVEERLNMLEHVTKIIDIEMKMNSEFRVKWPRGELGALPDDAEQNLRLDFLEKKVDKLIGGN